MHEVYGTDGRLLDEELRCFLLEEDNAGAAAQPGTVVTEAPLSFAQRNVWFFEQWNPGTPTYNVGSAYAVEGPLDGQTLEQAAHEVARRHPALRTGFATRGSETVQVVGVSPAVPFQHRDLSTLPAAQREEQARALAEEEVRRPFRLDRGQPLRALLIRLAADRHLLVLTVHHIVCDGLSMGLLLRDLGQSYRALLAGQNPALPPAPGYPDFAVWERQRWESGAVADGLRHWQAQLAGAPEVTQLPTSRPRPAEQTFRGNTLRIEVDRELAALVRRQATALRTTPFVLMFTAFSAFVARYTGQRDVVLGTPVAIRDAVDAGFDPEQMVGPLINTLPLRTELSDNPVYRDLLDQVRDTVADAQEHSSVPFERIVDALGRPRALSYSPVFQLVFGVQEEPVGGWRLGSAQVTAGPAERGTAKFDMTWNVIAGDATRIELEYNTDLYDQAAVLAMVAS